MFRSAKNILFIGLSFLAISCKNEASENPQKGESIKTTGDSFTTVIDSLTLANFFEAEEIRIDTLDRRLHITISNSNLLRKQRDEMGTKWNGPEPWVSVAATYQSSFISSNVDSLIYEVKQSVETFRFSFSVQQMKKALHYLKICIELANSINEKDYSGIRQRMSPEIRNSYNDAQIKDFIKTTFGKKAFNHTELIGTKIINSKYTLYLNFWNSSGEVQAFAFSFIDDSDSVAGIEIKE